MLAKNMSFLSVILANTLHNQTREVYTLSDKNISSDWESKEWRNLQYR
jgi:hypothetical protein